MNNSHESRRRILMILGLGLALSSASPTALAAPQVGGSSGPNEQACAGRSVGDACSLPNRQLGTCAEGTCNRLDYSGGSPPKSTEESCVVCAPGADSQEVDGGPMLGSGGPPAEAGESKDSASSAGSDEPPTSVSRCSVGRSQPAAPGALGLALLALFGMRRARRAR